MNGKAILTVAGHEWRSALHGVSGTPELPAMFIHHEAAEAVVLLATQPAAFSALALEAGAGGVWLPTLLDLTLGDTDMQLPLIMLGDDHACVQHRLGGTPNLQLPVDQASLRSALSRANQNAVKTESGRLSEHFPNLESIRVRYQPLVRLRDFLPVSVEVLARVATKDGKVLGPQYVVAEMINSETAMRLTSLIIQIALQEVTEGNFADIGLNFAFNLPLDAMLHPNLINIFETMRSNVHMPSKALGFELTESQPVTDFVRAEIVIRAMRAAGYRLSLDDITPATHGLDTLLKMPFGGIKLDRGVVAGAESKDQATADFNREFIRNVCALAMARHQAVVAEGIESLQTLNLMQELGVTHGQGYFFARPLPARAVKPWLKHWKASKLRPKLPSAES